MSASDVLLDTACSLRVRAAVQAAFPGVRLRVHDLRTISQIDPAVVNQTCAVVLGMRNSQGALSIDLIEQVRAIAPHIGVFVIEEYSEAVDPWLPRLAMSGADDAFALDRSGDEKVLRLVLQNRVAVPPPEIVLRKLQSHWSVCPVKVEAMYCVRNGYRPRHRFEPHVWLRTTGRSLRTKFSRAGIPTPLFLTAFGRDLHWRESMARYGRNLIELATLLGFETVEQARREHRRVQRRAARWPSLPTLDR